MKDNKATQPQEKTPVEYRQDALDALQKAIEAVAAIRGELTPIPGNTDVGAALSSLGQCVSLLETTAGGIRNGT
jgi:hypothetical protein